MLDLFFTPLKKAHPELREVYLAGGELALKKADFALAAKMFGEGAKRFEDDPDFQFGLARAYQPSDPEVMLAAIKETLEGNPQHIGAKLLLAEHLLDAEHPEEAATAIDEALKTDPKRPEAHALRAVLAELAGNPQGYKDARAAALASWKKNPAVEHLIGKKLSQKYRFAEGSTHQRSALSWDPSFLPSKLQLAQDLLRLGEEAEGWRLAQEVQTADPYNVVAYNLVTLEETLAKFSNLPSAHFVVRMEPHEAEVYGQRVVALLERAHAQLGAKYGFDAKQKVSVEIFPDQKDFAIRTFGLPGGAGYLGVCFGNVITANSPAARPGSSNNWESVLWHEFTHVITLGLTKNRMPRWLSEGISVYEERQARGNWGEQMKPRYRAMILGDDFTPLSKLSEAFLRPKTGLHLQFAYYESSLAVEYLLERFGLPAIKAIFADLSNGVALNAALAKHAAPLETLDQEFAERARNLARSVGPELDWERPEPLTMADPEKLRQWHAQHPNSYVALLAQARQLIEKRGWGAAKAPLIKLIQLYPDQHEADGAYAELAAVHRALGEKDEELAVLTKLATLASDATEALARLMEIHAERKEWQKVTGYAEQLTAVHPLDAKAHLVAAQAWRELNEPAKSIAEYQTLLKLEGDQHADTHYQLATLMRDTGKNTEAKSHVLLALEETPRYRAALRLLLQLEEKVPLPPPTPAAKPPVLPKPAVSQ